MERSCALVFILFIWHFCFSQAHQKTDQDASPVKKLVRKMLMIMSRPARLLECLVSSYISLLLIREIKVVSIKTTDQMTLQYANHFNKWWTHQLTYVWPMDWLTDGQTDRQTDWETNGQTDWCTERQTDGWTDRQTDRKSRDCWANISCLVLISRSLALKVFIISWRKKKESWRGFLTRLTSLTTLNSSLDLFNLKNPDRTHLRTPNLNHNRYKAFVFYLILILFLRSFSGSLPWSVACSLVPR